MKENHPHYNLDKLDSELQKLAAENKLTGPCFVGQGLSKQVGSDCYGYYIVNGKWYGKNNRFVWGIASAKQVMHSDWTEGTMDCSIDMSNAKPDSWITKYGKHWYFCDANGKRYAGRKCSYYWNGAYGYQDPSF